MLVAKTRYYKISRAKYILGTVTFNLCLCLKIRDVKRLPVIRLSVLKMIGSISLINDNYFYHFA